MKTSRIRELRDSFATAHRQGMAGLQSRDFDAFGEAVRKETEAIDALLAESTAVGVTPLPTSGQGRATKKLPMNTSHNETTQRPPRR